jgi:hypothetical protein
MGTPKEDNGDVRHHRLFFLFFMGAPKEERR